MKVLLDENFPLGLLRRLHADGFAAEHIITLGWRGAPGTRIRERLGDEQVLFLTQDDDFLFGPTGALARGPIARLDRGRRVEPLAAWDQQSLRRSEHHGSDAGPFLKPIGARAR